MSSEKTEIREVVTVTVEDDEGASCFAGETDASTSADVIITIIGGIAY